MNELTVFPKKKMFHGLAIRFLAFYPKYVGRLLGPIRYWDTMNLCLAYELGKEVP